MRTQKWIKKSTRSLRGKRIAVTGSTGGLGQELCRYLCELGASLILLNRNVERAERQKSDLLSRFPEANILCLPLDLESIESAAVAAERLIAKEIDIFVHNAGAYSIPRYICKSGYDNVFTINFAAPYFMIRRLTPSLQARGGKVVVVGSIAHRYSKIRIDDVDFRQTKSAAKAYGNAKRYLMFSLFEATSADSGLSISVTHPGITFTNITAHYPKPIFAIIKYPMKLIFMHPRRAVCSILYGIFEETSSGEWIGPHIFDIWGMPKKKKLHSCKPKEQDDIVRIAEQVYLTCEESLTRQRSAL